MRRGIMAFLLRNLSTEVPVLKKSRFPYIIEANPDQARRPQLTSPRTQAVISPAALETVSPLKVVIAP
jgi:hypothetical protein